MRHVPLLAVAAAMLGGCGYHWTGEGAGKFTPEPGY